VMKLSGGRVTNHLSAPPARLNRIPVSQRQQLGPDHDTRSFPPPTPNFLGSRPPMGQADLPTMIFTPGRQQRTQSWRYRREKPDLRRKTLLDNNFRRKILTVCAQT
jgi:hypothetical protein